MKLILLLALATTVAEGAAKAKYRTLSRGVDITEFKLAPAVPIGESTDFDLTPKGAPVLLAKGRIFSSLSGKPLLPANSDGVDAFAYHQGDAILTSSRGKLGYLGENGVVGKVALPAPGMKLRSVSASVLALYGGNGPAASAIYLYKKDGTFKKYVEAGGTVEALAAREDQMLFAVRGAIFEVPAGKDPKVRLMVPGEDITSIAYASYQDSFLFTTPKGVFFSSGTNLLPIVTGIACKVRAAKDASFYALCAPEKKLMRIALNFSEITKTSTAWKK